MTLVYKRTVIADKAGLIEALTEQQTAYAHEAEHARKAGMRISAAGKVEGVAFAIELLTDWEPGKPPGEKDGSA